jgi:hypothetical protein
MTQGYDRFIEGPKSGFLQGFGPEKISNFLLMKDPKYIVYR